MSRAPVHGEPIRASAFGQIGVGDLFITIESSETALTHARVLAEKRKAFAWT